MKAFTFLGTGKLHKSTYIFEGNSSQPIQFFAEAIVEFFNPELLYIFATESAARAPVAVEHPISKENPSRQDLLLKSLKEKTKVKIITIPEGKNETQLWEIFNIVVKHIEDNDKVVFDITHGFRSLPFLTFLALAYVRKIRRNVEIERVIYGAYEAVEISNPEKPVFDLTPFVNLLEWLSAVTMFQQTGDAHQIADLLSSHVGAGLSTVSNNLRDLSAALLTNRTLEVQESAAELLNNLKESKATIASEVRPFQTLLDQIRDSYEPLVLANPRRSQPDKSLRKQHEQIKWYAENQQYLQAVTLTREWLISWACVQLRRGGWLTSRTRLDIENILNRLERGQPNVLPPGKKLPEKARCIELWKQTGTLRNDLTHCGMGSQSRRSSTGQAISQAKKILKGLNDFVDKTL